MSARPRARGAQPPARSTWALAAPIAAAAVYGACVERGYPLPQSGTVLVLADVNGKLYAADSLDENGKPTGLRQQPYSTGISMEIKEGEEPAYGGYVSVRVEPSEALTLVSDEAEGDNPTCEPVDGAFRCMGTEEGRARFKVISESDWSGTATVVVTWSGSSREELPIVINPAGLPAEAANFALVVGKDTSKKILAEYTVLECATDMLEPMPSEKWRPGAIRHTEARMLVSPPAANPLVVENAPVHVEALHPEAEMSLSEDCAERVRVLKVRLNADGQSDPFFLCFSDIGGNVQFAFSSGEQSGVMNSDDRIKTITVEPEPRYLRVRRLSVEIDLLETAKTFEIAAFNADREQIAMPVDFEIDDSILELEDGASAVTLPDPQVLSLIATGRGLGVAELKVSPRLIGKPVCVSAPVTVVDPFAL